MAYKKSISAVIPNYNGRSLLQENLPYLIAALEKAEVEYEIIVADDASTDDSVTFLKSHFPIVKVITSNINSGFSPTANRGIFSAVYELVFIMNSDVKIIGDYFSTQFRYFAKQDTFGVMGRIIGLDNDNIQDGAKTQYHFGLKIGDNKNLIPLDTHTPWFPTLYLSGANALIRKDLLFKLRGYDEIYAPFYGEDLDLCLRAWKLGWKSYYEYNSVCRHPNSITINKYHKKKKIQKIVYRNRFIMHEIHLSQRARVLWNIWVILQLIYKFLFFKTEFYEGFKEFYRMKDAAKDSYKKLHELGRKEGILLNNKSVYKYLRKQFKAIPHKEL